MELEKRMRLHKPGQVTWLSPELGAKCSECRFFSGSDLARSSQKKGKGRCNKVMLTQGVNGAVFTGREAIACSVFERSDE